MTLLNAPIVVDAPDWRKPRSNRVSARATLSARVFALVIAAGCLAVLLTAARVTPSRAGTGSHKSLGLQSCALLERSGIPCPSCGMTTSFAWFVRGNFVASFYVQPMGMLAAFAAACSVWVGLYIAITGRPLHRLGRQLPARAYIVGILGLAALAWGWKTWLVLRGADGW